MDINTSHRMLFLSSVALEVAALGRAQVCLAGVFACLARDKEEAGRIMSFMQKQDEEKSVSVWARAKAAVGKLNEDGSLKDPEDPDLINKKGSFFAQTHDGFRPTGVPTEVGTAVAATLRMGAAQLDSSIMGPRRALAAMLRYAPMTRSTGTAVDGSEGAAWVRVHAAAAIGNLAAHPIGVTGEAALQGTYRRVLLEGEMFEIVLSACTIRTNDPLADSKCAEAGTSKYYARHVLSPPICTGAHKHNQKSAWLFHVLKRRCTD
jgi:hypothetical protein